MKIKSIFFIISLSFLLFGCSSSVSTNSEGGIYDERKSKYLSGEEVKQLFQGNTVSYSDEYGTSEYYHGSGRLFIYYKESENFHNAHWCVVGNKICVDSPSMKLHCQNMAINKSGKIRYLGSKASLLSKELKQEGNVTIAKGDILNIKKDYDENGWKLHEKRLCP